MKLCHHLLRLLDCLVFLFTVACGSYPSSITSSLSPGETLTPVEVLSTFSGVDRPTVFAPLLNLTPSATPLGTVIPAETDLVASTTTVILPSPTPCPPNLCTYSAQFFLQRPIAPPGNSVADVTYRFGSTMGGLRDPHHGVEFLNSYGTPVLAAADGRVVVAGDDRLPTSPQGAWPITFWGPYSYFYGNLVVIEHTLPEALQALSLDIPQPLYTLYAHLSRVLVELGQQVSAGQKIGEVGMTGVATGPHLHFEVRLGENSYQESRNPELWLFPRQDQNGHLMGAIAGRVMDASGNILSLDYIVLKHFPDGPDQPGGDEIYLLTYEDKALIGKSPWGESFSAADLVPGWYRISFPYFGLREIFLQVYSGQLTVVTIQME